MIESVESCSVESIIRLEGDAEEVALGFNDLEFLETTVSRGLTF